eukprot:GHVS01072648.1.p1 GENE.GHVS01072648.1~~GHVS01072648.1.p1  ORF type:complete len:630 (+),score=42.22 GHVS01072648.1:235-2124(+)
MNKMYEVQSTQNSLEEKTEKVPPPRASSSSRRVSHQLAPPSRGGSLASSKGAEATHEWVPPTSPKSPRLEIATTPWGVNRYVLLVLYSLVSLMTGCCYWGWPGVQDMLYKSGAFTWKCVPGQTEPETVNGVDYPNCAARRNAIGDMYTTAFACHFGFSAIAGTILDLAGSKACGLLGLGLTGLGWILLSVGSESVEGAYYAGIAFIGSGADTCNLPLLSLANLFPGNESLILSILGSVRSVSFAMPVIMAKIYTGSSSYTASDFGAFCYGYVGVCVGVSVLIAIFLVPRRAFKVAGKTDEEAALPEEREAAARSRRMSVYTGAMMPPVSTSARDIREIIQEVRGGSVDYSAQRNSYQLAEGQRRNSMMAVTDVPSSSEQVEDAAYGIGIVEQPGRGRKEESYLDQLKKPEFLLIVPFFCICLIRGEFFSKSNREMLVTSSGNNVYEIFTILNIMTFIPGPIFGKLCDTIGILWVILIINTDGIFMYFFVIFDAYASKLISTIFFFVYTSFVLSNLYCYVADTFPAEHFGKLTGLASLCGGMFTLTSMGFYRMSTGDTFESLGAYQFAPACAIMIAFGILNFGLWTIMKVIQIRKTGAEKDTKRVAMEGVVSVRDAEGVKGQNTQETSKA